MPEYYAPLPWILLRDEIEALRGLGSVEHTFRVDFPSRATAVRELGDEFDWMGLGHGWWDRYLSGRRRRRGEEEN